LSDLTKKVTMQNLFNDGGFSNIGMSWRAMNVYSTSLEDMKNNIDKIID